MLIDTVIVVALILILGAYWYVMNDIMMEQRKFYEKLYSKYLKDNDEDRYND